MACDNLSKHLESLPLSGLLKSPRQKFKINSQQPHKDRSRSPGVS